MNVKVRWIKFYFYYHYFGWPKWSLTWGHVLLGIVLTGAMGVNFPLILFAVVWSPVVGPFICWSLVQCTDPCYHGWVSYFASFLACVSCQLLTGSLCFVLQLLFSCSLCLVCMKIIRYTAFSYYLKAIYTVEPWFNEVPRDWGNWFIISRVRYMEVLFHTLHYYWAEKYCSLC